MSPVRAVRPDMTNAADSLTPSTIRVLYRDPATGDIVVPKPARLPSFPVAA